MQLILLTRHQLLRIRTKLIEQQLTLVDRLSEIQFENQFGIQWKKKKIVDGTYIEGKALANCDECGKCCMARKEYIIQLHWIQTTWKSMSVFILQIANKSWI